MSELARRQRTVEPLTNERLRRRMSQTTIADAPSLQLVIDIDVNVVLNFSHGHQETKQTHKFSLIDGTISWICTAVVSWPSLVMDPCSWYRLFVTLAGFKAAVARIAPLSPFGSVWHHNDLKTWRPLSETVRILKYKLFVEVLMQFFVRVLAYYIIWNMFILRFIFLFQVPAAWM